MDYFSMGFSVITMCNINRILVTQISNQLPILFSFKGA